MKSKKTLPIIVAALLAVAPVASIFTIEQKPTVTVAAKRTHKIRKVRKTRRRSRKVSKKRRTRKVRRNTHKRARELSVQTMAQYHFYESEWVADPKSACVSDPNYNFEDHAAEESREVSKVSKLGKKGMDAWVKHYGKKQANKVDEIVDINKAKGKKIRRIARAMAAKVEKEYPYVVIFA